MQPLTLRKASRQKSKLRLNISSPSGGGKTTGALLIAAGMVNGDWSKVGYIDTEQGSSELYVGRSFGSTTIGEFQVIPLGAPYSPERYIQAIALCEDAGIEVLVIDSASHEWVGTGGCLQINDQLANASNSRNASFASWNETKRRHRMFIDKMLNSSCHIICTSRSKTDHFIADDGKVKKLGLKEQQEGDFEYEFTLTFNSLDREKNLFKIGKNRTDIDYGLDGFVITEKYGSDLIRWAVSGKEPIPEIKFKAAPVEELEEIKSIIEEVGMSNDDRKALFEKHGFVGKPSEMDSDASHKIVMDLLDIRVKHKLAKLPIDEGSAVVQPDPTFEGLKARSKILGCQADLMNYCKANFENPKSMNIDDLRYMEKVLNAYAAVMNLQKETGADIQTWLEAKGANTIWDCDPSEVCEYVQQVQESKEVSNHG